MHESPAAVLAAFDGALRREDADLMTDLFTADAQLLFANRDPAIGREAIHGYWAPVFALNETTEAKMECPTIQTHGDHAYALCTYAETVRPRAGGARRRLYGRAVFFLRQEPDGAWRIAMTLNSPARPAEELSK